MATLRRRIDRLAAQLPGPGKAEAWAERPPDPVAEAADAELEAALRAAIAAGMLWQDADGWHGELEPGGEWPERWLVWASALTGCGWPEGEVVENERK